jgi:nucleotide-binding universal stress UspA family protein
MIRDSGILHYFPQRTETDLYLWISNYRKELESELGLQIRPERALSDLTSRYTSGVSGVFSRAGGKMLNLIIPTSLADGPDAGEWRQRSPHVRRGDRLFLDILVPIDGRESGWRALSQALIIAQREQARIFGLHVITSGKKIQKAKIEKIELEFIKRCAEANISGSFSHAAGKIFLEINQRARWADLVVTSLSHPPGPFFKDRLDSGIRKLVQSCPRPLLVVPGYPSALKHALLAYDGSPKADEGLFVASYLANQWRASLTVLTAFIGDHVAPETLLRARVYLEEHKIDASYLAETQPTAQAVQHTVVDHQIDLVIAGGYRLSPVREVLFGSTVDQLMRQSEIPLLICR